MRWVAVVMATLLVVGLGGCSSKFKTYNGPEVTRVLIYKENRSMYLMHHDTALKKYEIGLGFQPDGHKLHEGDGRTPEGLYHIDRRNPNSEFHLSIGISYPNDADRERASAIGKSPGGDIFIHGGPNRRSFRDIRDWTAGCVAVSDDEMEDIYAMVKDGTPVLIHP